MAKPPAMTAGHSKEIVHLKSELSNVERQRDKALRDKEELERKVQQLSEEKQTLKASAAAARAAHREGEQQNAKHKSWETRYRDLQDRYAALEGRKKEVEANAETRAAELSGLVKQWQDHCTALTQAKEAAEQMQAEESATRMRLVDDIATSREAHDALRRDFDELRESRGSLMDQLAAAQSRSSEVSEQLDAARQEADELRQVSRFHEEQVAKLQAVEADLVANLETAQSTIRRHEDRINQLKETADSERGHRSQIESTEARLRAELTRADEARADLQMRLDKEHSEVTALNARAAKLTADLERQQGAVTESQAGEQSLRGKITQQAEEVAAKQKELTDLRVELSTAQSQLLYKDQAIKLLEADVARAKHETERIESSTAATRTQAETSLKDALDKQVEAMTRIETLEATIVKMEKDAADAAGDLGRSRERVADLEGLLEGAHHKEANALRSADTAAGTAKEYVEAKNEAERNAAAAVAEQKELESRLASVQADHAATSDALGTCEANLASTRAELNDVRGELTALEHRMAEGARLYDLLQSELGASQQSLADSTAAAAELDGKLRAERDLHAAASGELEQTARRHEATMGELAQLRAAVAQHLALCSELLFTGAVTDDASTNFITQLIGDATAAVRHTHGRLEKLETDLPHAQHDMADMKRKYESMRSAYEEARQQLASQEAEAKREGERRARSESAVTDRLRAQTADLQRELDDERRRMKRKVDELDRSNAKTTHSLEKYKKGFQEMKDKYVGLNESANRCADKIATQKGWMEGMKRDFDLLRRHYETLEKQYIDRCGQVDADQRRGVLEVTSSSDARAKSLHQDAAAEAEDTPRQSNVLGLLGGNTRRNNEAGRKSEGRKSVTFSSKHEEISATPMSVEEPPLPTQSVKRTRSEEQQRA